jgi:hypothetical protein
VLQSVSELLLLPFKFAGDFFVLLYEHATTARRIDGATFGRCHQPRAGLSGMPSSGQRYRGWCLLDYGVPVFTDDVAASNYPVFKGPATL